jgi:hypothetical protein
MRYHNGILQNTCCDWLLVDIKGIHLYLMLIPLAMWSGLSSLNCTQKVQLLNLFHLGVSADNQYYTMFCGSRLSVGGTDSMKFLMFVLPTCNHTSHH